MTVIRRDGVTWVADRSGLAHADASDKTYRALCGARPTAPRYAWPIREWCPTCVTLERARKAGAA